ncbi:Uncharacterised protein [Raoultella terrigena]|uniref:Uncharacterized protein n=1 Tax=Raoultella terrigena TaxID=577 RepID=A0A3P8KLU2_RAOTE|nr:Uncharacterised protein [Raoultella terrigena]
MLPELGGDACSKTDNLMRNRANGSGFAMPSTDDPDTGITASYPFDFGLPFFCRHFNPNQNNIPVCVKIVVQWMIYCLKDRS